MAADCNHDGYIDLADVNLLKSAGLLISNIDQSKPVEELQQDSAYLNYVELIDQSPDNITSEFDVLRIIEMVMNFIESLLDTLTGVIL